MDLALLKTAEDFYKLAENDSADLFDDSASFEKQSNIEMNPDLAEWEIADAMFWRQFLAQGGVMLITGAPGSGKNLLVNMACWKARRYFPSVRVARDDKPRRLFGPYIPWSNAWLIEQLKRLNELGSFHVDEQGDTTMGNAGQWMTTRGECLLHRLIQMLDEFHSYFDRRMRYPETQTLGDLFKVMRHLDCLTLGMTTNREDLDIKRCMKRVTAEAACVWSSVRRDWGSGLKAKSSLITIRSLVYQDEKGGWLKVGRKFKPFLVDGDMPRPQLGENPNDRLAQIVGEHKLTGRATDVKNIIKMMLENRQRPTRASYISDLAGIPIETVLGTFEDFRIRGIVEVYPAYYRYFDLFNSKNARRVKIPKSLLKEAG